MIELRDVCFSARGKRKILDQISFSAMAGEFIVITGANGSGKSTLAQIIMGIKKQSEGKIFFHGEDVSDLSVTERAKKGISLSFQQPIKFKGLTVLDLLNVAHSSTISEGKAKSLLENVGLDSTKYRNREIDSSLSGGELKRIEIATVLAKDADLMIFDEPEAGIDLWSFSDLARVFKKLHKEQKTIIIISDQEKILKLADKIIILENGKIKDFGRKEDVLSKIVEERK